MSPTAAPSTGAVAELMAALLAHCTFPPPGSSVTCAVSGGADSSALALLAVAAGCEVRIAHVHHGLRPGADADAALVEQLAARLGVPCTMHHVHIEPGPNLEARARVARYAALAPGALTGHTADDQAETVVLNLLRGAATTGLAAMRPGPTRPLLALRRTDTVHLCRRAGLAVADDESNRDPRYRRSRVRHEVLPLLATVADRDLVPLLTRQAELLRADDDLLNELAATLDPTDARALAAAPPPLARRAVRRWLADVEAEHHPPDRAAVDRVLAVARGEAAACEVAGVGRVARHRQRLSLIPLGHDVA
jgi:tRNA(Ile)-lysidine synthase